MNGYLYASIHPLDWEALSGLLNEFPAEYVYLENEYAVNGDYAVNLWTQDGLAVAGDYRVGRVFGAEAELRWQVSPDGYDVQILLERQLEAAPDGFRLSQDIFVCGDEVGIHLWGTPASQLTIEHYLSQSRPENVWIETRIPRPLVYPANPERRVQIRALPYCLNGLVITTRWLGLKEV